MCTADAWRIAKTTNYGILPRIMAFRRQRTDGLRTALRTNSFAAFTGQSDLRATYNSTIRQLIMELENCNSHGDHVPTTPQHENDSGNKKWYRQASQRLVINFSLTVCKILKICQCSLTKKLIRQSSVI
ncbi:hypothetical protein WN51_00685 [Melipona quadrifasciata]|uniref:Uncharacterized protein n=1 Tax=Melipona quadrifasciata TaxID=166423 RepID=A0A0M8ZWV4_9HYME|nr:hypothetical protein WN51_00685 [Melipona quadrifasciata]